MATLEDATDGDLIQAREVGPEEARAAWALAARDVLIETARQYRAVITYKELAAEVQQVGTFGEQLLAMRDRRSR